jgi:hypothetical protein
LRNARNEFLFPILLLQTLKPLFQITTTLNRYDNGDKRERSSRDYKTECPEQQPEIHERSFTLLNQSQ